MNSHSQNGVEFRVPHKVRADTFRALGALGLVPMTLAFSSSARSQDVPAANPPLANAPLANAPGGLSHLQRGRTYLAASDARAVAELRTASQESLQNLSAALAAASATVAHPEDTQAASAAALAAREATESAASAHFLWGMAADRFSRRDEAITALARALNLANAAAVKAPGEAAGDTTELQRDTSIALSGVLRAGLPMFAADDALNIIASQAHGGLWTPVRSTFALPSFDVSKASARDGGTRNSGVLSLDFLVTSGKVFPPERDAARPDQARPNSSRLTRVAPLFAGVPPNALPAALRMDRVVLGYARETAGANRGLWRQAVRVFYASPYATRNNRDDRPRAEALCLQFMRVRATTRAGLGLGNPYPADGVTTLWLSEVSALWPEDEDEPELLKNRPLKLPKINTPNSPNEKLPVEITENPLSRPWQAAATLDSAPGDILFFKVAQPRSQAGWLRQLMHEYGHVALPPFGRFETPLEPFGNGTLGETLEVLWAGQSPRAWLEGDEESTPDYGRTLQNFSATLGMHIEQNAAPALALWKRSGPLSLLKNDRTDAGLNYLNGLAVGIERTYGAPFLGKILAPLAQRAPQNGVIGKMPILGAQALFNSSAWQADVWNNESEIPVWIGGVLDVKMPTSDLIQRAPISLQNTIASGWIWVPPFCEWLKISWRGAGNVRAIGWRQNGNAPGELRLSSPAGSLQPRGSWQKLSFAVTGNIIITNAQFERHLE